MEPAARTTDLEALGGEAVVRRWVDRFYDQVPGDPILAPLFPPDLTASRDKQFEFFVQFLGGPPLYTQRHGQPFLRYKHRRIRIGQPERDAWLRLMLAGLAEQHPEPALEARIAQRLATLATDMINHHPERKDAQFFN